MLIADTLSPSDIAAIARIRDAWLRAINTDDLAGLEAAGTEDLVALPQHEAPLVGMAANREWHRARIQQFSTHLTMSTEEVQGGSTWAFERLAFAIELTPRAGGAPVRDRGNCLWAWQRQSDGSWKVARAIWNSDVPIAATGTEMDAAAIMRVADEYTMAVNACNLDATMATLASEIAVLPPDEPLVAGTAAVRNWLKTQFFDPFYVNLSFSFTELEIRGDRAVAYGPFQLALTPRGGGSAIQMAGKFIDVYHRQPDASWKFRRIIFNRDQPAAVPSA